MHCINKATATEAILTVLRAMLPALALAACTNSYPSLTEDDQVMISNDESLDLTPLMVFVNEQEFFSVASTRGSGPFDREESDTKYENAEFYVFAFRDGPDFSGYFSSPANLQRWAYAENAPASLADTDNADCLLDGFDYNYGMTMHLSRDEAGALNTELSMVDGNAILYYSPTYTYVGYNFFAFYLDDASVTPHREQSQISYDIEIDGTQDLLAGKAPELTATVLDDKLSALYGNTGSASISQTERNTILNIGNYSTYAARRNIHPVIDMSHLLTRLNFNAIAGDEASNDIVITKVTVESKYKGTLVAAAADADEAGELTWDDERATLELREASVDGEACEPLREEGYVVEYNEADNSLSWTERPKTDIGGSLLLPPDDKYVLTVYYTQTINGEPYYTYAQHTLQPKTDSNYYDSETGSYMFRPGWAYTVTFVVYGLRGVEIYVDITSWVNGGDIDIDLGK